MRSLLTLCLVLPAIGACRGGITEDTPVVPIRNMYEQPRYDPQQASPFFEDGRTMRPPVEGAIAQEMPIDLSVQTGRTADDASWLLEPPGSVIRDFLPTIDQEDYEAGRNRRPRRGWNQFSDADKQAARLAMIERGGQRYNIYCGPCHSEAGDGNGPVSLRAQWLAETLRDSGSAGLNAPTLHDDRIRSMPDGQLYGVITNGIRNMPAYSQSIPVDDRWAIVSYVRALQINQASRTSADATQAQQGEGQEVR
ncbi:MAG: cytochrome c [Myxococcota bacterium]